MEYKEVVETAARRSSGNRRPGLMRQAKGGVKMNKIKKLREAHKMTQAELAERVGVGRSTVTKWENGDAIPRPKILIKLSRMFGCRIEDLIFLRRRT